MEKRLQTITDFISLDLANLRQDVERLAAEERQLSDRLSDLQERIRAATAALILKNANLQVFEKIQLRRNGLQYVVTPNPSTNGRPVMIRIVRNEIGKEATEFLSYDAGKFDRLGFVTPEEFYQPLK